MIRVRVEYPWPSAKLVPHAKGNWRAKASATKSARHEAGMVTLAASQRLQPLIEKKLCLVVEFYPPDARRRDVMNTIAACKAMIDGIADVMGTDDSQFEIEWPPRYAEPVERGKVIVEFQEVRG